MVETRRRPPFLLLDFDSTLVTVESLDELFDRVVSEVGLAAADGPGGRTRFRELTDAGMDGTSSQAETLRRRLALFPPGTLRPETVAAAGRAIAEQVAPSVLRNAEFFRGYDGILIVSGGFSELILPAARRLGIPEEQVVAHAFRPARAMKGTLELDPRTPMARGGKVGAIRALAAAGVIPSGRPLWILGDGATDLELRTAGVAERFVAFTENVVRPPVVAAADHVARTFDEFLELLP
jgi:D-3-phosphoglycerate dehydrogenase / 2-oxoglutarate reductase